MESAAKSESIVVPLVREKTNILAPTQLGGLSIDLLQDKVSSLMSKAASPQEVALCVLSTLQKIIVEEAGKYSFEQGLEDSLHALEAPAAMRAAFLNLYKKSKEILYDSLLKKECDQGNSLVLVEELYNLLEWYGDRKATLKKIDCNESLKKLGGEGFFNFTLLHDREQQGVYGAEIRTGLILDSRGGKNYSLRAHVLFRGAPLRCKRSWKTWTFPDGGDSFAAELPILAKRLPKIGRKVLDEVTLFIPYDALLWPDDVHTKTADVSILLGLYTAREKLFSQLYLEQMRVCMTLSPEKKLLSPQALDIWQSCPIHGHELKRFSMQWVSDHVSFYKGKVEFSVDAHIRGMAGQEVSLIARILDEDGNMVKSVNPQTSDERGRFCSEFYLSVNSSIANYSRIGNVIDPADLGLEAGEHSLKLEITIEDKERRTLCGTVEPFVLAISQR